jgi:hypothetical protein
MFNDLKELFDEIQFQEEKIVKFQNLLKAKQFNNIQIHFFADGKHYTIYQSDLPFVLENELKCLFADTIDQLHLNIQSLKTNLA